MVDPFNLINYVSNELFHILHIIYIKLTIFQR